MAKTSSYEQLEEAIRRVVLLQQEVISLLDEVLSADLPEGKTRFDLFCERLEKVKNAEATKK